MTYRKLKYFRVSCDAYEKDKPCKAYINVAACGADHLREVLEGYKWSVGAEGLHYSTHCPAHEEEK